jgi:hypothetical protein
MIEKLLKIAIIAKIVEWWRNRKNPPPGQPTA